MANARIQNLTEDTALVGTDWLVAEVGDSEARKVSVTNLTKSFSGYEYDYVEQATQLTVTATSEATAHNFITGNPITFDGSTRICIEFDAVFLAAASGTLVVQILQDSTVLGWLTQTGPGVVAPVLVRRFLTPANGSHTYKIQAWKTAGTCSIGAGAGGTGDSLPAYMRITKA